jgi:lipopolysaccharide transport system ATP-binding protein
MSDAVIRAVDLRKVYRLYAKPSYRFRDMFGLLGHNPSAYTEHAALDGIDLEIARGEKVAFIGRNGAGKSTLLKLITNVIQPTSGTLEVKGRVHALLQIGTGFHPDFTGRENVHAYLAQLGITGADASRKCAEAIEFAELEEYIDQPVKTYSTGMGVRLMFAASTAISPELLVLDEVLGVGDAYFAQKSFERMKELCERSGTTLLLVTHDIYSAVRLCERVVWIDRGRVLKDADGPTVIAMYEDSIRQQEEQRLRAKASRRARELATHGERGAALDTTEVSVEIRARDNVPQPALVYFSRIELFVNGTSAGLLPLDAVTRNSRAWLQTEGTAWGEPVLWEGRSARPMNNFGSSFHKVAGVIVVPGNAAEVEASSFAVSIDCWSEQPYELTTDCFVDGRLVPLGRLPASSGEWTTAHVDGTHLDEEPETGLSGRHGTGVIAVDSVRPLDRDRREAYSFRHGDPFELEIAYRVNTPGLRERAQVLVAFQRDGVHDVMRTITRDLLFDEAQARRGIVSMRFPRLRLANGSYSVTVMVAKEGYYDETQSRYFAVNPGVYTCLARAFEIVVEGGGIVGTGTGVVSDAEWAVIPAGTLAPVDGACRFDFPAVIAREFPAEFPLAQAAVDRVLARVAGADLSALARRSPGLAGYDWTGYLQCSVIRMVRVLRGLRASAAAGGRVLDCGAYFGNVALMCAAAGYEVDALDSYSNYAPGLDACVALMRESGVRVRDFTECGTRLEGVEDGRYDAVVCLGVIEHLPHTPRPFLEALNRVLKPGGTLIMDTPNIAYLYNREKLARGESIMPPLPVQFHVDGAFEGHHREYTPSEIRWILETLAHRDIRIDTFNFSAYALERLTHQDVINVRRMDADPDLRELIASISQKPS